MPVVKAARPNEIFGKENWSKLKSVSNVYGIWLVVHCWLVIVASMAIAIWLNHPIAYLIAIIIVGGRQLGLAILMHDAAHGLLHNNRKINNFLGQWLTGAPTGSDVYAYRTYHLTHHKFTQQPEDPDLGLSKPFPTSKASMRRKILRDLTGQTFFKQRGNQLVKLFKNIAPNNNEANIFNSAAFIRFLGAHLVLLLLSFVSGFGVVPFLIWLVALATVFQLFLRVRNIAEHACTSTGDDPFSHARTTQANWLARATVAPYWVNFHSEHHLFMGLPCYNLPKAHKKLIALGYAPRMTLAPSYWSVMKRVTSSEAIS